MDDRTINCKIILIQRCYKKTLVVYRYHRQIVM